MSGTNTLVDTLKRSLKSKGITYKTLAAKWDLSEASVKRLMSEGDLTLDRIESACNLMKITFGELIKLTPFDLETTEQALLPDQELEFAKEPRLYHFWVLITEGRSLKYIERNFVISKNDLQKFSLKLDHMKLIELHPKGKIKVIAKNRTMLRKDGPLGQMLLEQTKTVFLNHPFKNTQLEHLRFAMYRLNPQSAIRYKAKIDKMLNEMKLESEIERTQGESIEFGMLIALRPWSSNLLQALEKKSRSEKN